MGERAVSAALRRFKRRAECRVLCGACGWFFPVSRSAIGDRIECTRCGEIVELGGVVTERRHVASSRTLITSWLDRRGSAASESAFRVALCAVLVVTTAAALASYCTSVTRVEALTARDPFLDEPPPPDADD